ncbi:carbohydrate kinase family protein [Bacillus cihuensis]|uniref:carbohydrate kinase family protein n=1 Tax=Bacillus cihuensis TaxID=1208599 RepID=UPI0003FC964E|nr:PfkB family carbohydrate kinase [Bacillus cihuensis]
MSKYLIVSTAVTDEIHKKDSSEVKYALGGAGIYALAGAKIWSDDISILTGVGEDFQNLHFEWFQNNELPTQNLIIKDANTPRTIIRYEDEENRTETPFYGAKHYQKMNASVREIEEAVTCDTEGIYIFKGHDEQFWNEFFILNEQIKIKVLWELNADSAHIDFKQQVKSIVERIDVFSLNEKEAKSLFGESDLDVVIERLREWSINTIFLRVGSKGAYMLTKNELVKINSVKNIKVVDVTGGGNSSSAGVLIGLCENRSLEEMGLMGSIGAAICIEQEGVPTKIDKKTKEKAEGLLQKMMDEKGEWR